MTSISRKMAEFTDGLRYDDIPHDAIYEAKRFLLDSIGCALAATQNEDMQAMYRFTEKLGGTPEATVIGTGSKTNAPNAALMNGLLIRALDYNDIYWVQDPSHPSDLLGAVPPSLLMNWKCAGVMQPRRGFGKSAGTTLH
jgi:2-methylcitrate dehydratase